MKKQKELSMMDILDIFDGLIKLSNFLGSNDIPMVFINIVFDKEIKQKYNTIAKKYLEFKNAGIEDRAKMLDIKMHFPKKRK